MTSNKRFDFGGDPEQDPGREMFNRIINILAEFFFWSPCVSRSDISIY